MRVIRYVYTGEVDNLTHQFPAFPPSASLESDFFQSCEHLVHYILALTGLWVFLLGARLLQLQAIKR